MIEKPKYSFCLENKKNSLIISVLKYSIPDADSNWDKNWLEGEISVDVGGFKGYCKAEFMTRDFDNFKNQLERLYKKLKGTANFNTIDDQIGIRMVGDGLGHITSHCLIMDQVGIGNTLECEIKLDQTMIPIILNQLESILYRFPIV